METEVIEQNPDVALDNDASLDLVTDGKALINPLQALFENVKVTDPAPEEKTPDEEKPGAATESKPAAPVDKSAPTEKTPAVPGDGTKPVDDVDKFVESLSPKSRNRFTELANKHAEKLAESLVEKRMAESVKAGKMPDTAAFTELQSKYDALTKQHADTSKILREMDLTRTPEYQEQFVKPTAQLHEQIGAIAKNFDVDGAQLSQLLSKPVTKESAAQINALTEEMPVFVQQQLAALGLKLRDVREAESKVLADVDAARSAIAGQRKASHDAFIKRAQAENERVFDALLPELKKESAALFEGENAKENEELVTKIRDSLSTSVDALQADTKAKLLYNAVFGKQALAMVDQLKGRVSELNTKLEAALAEVKKYKDATPGIGSGGGQESGAPSEKTLWQRLNNQ